MQNAILHNPRCSKSRQTLALLEEKGIELDIVLYLETPPTVNELAEICDTLGVAPTDIIRAKEKRFAELGLSLSDDRSAGDWFELMVENPILIERPIVCYNGKVAVGRPPENVLGIL
jgi:arsenate reductase